MKLIDVEPLYKHYLELEKQAQERQMNYLDRCKADSPNVIKWSAILTERTAYKYDLQDVPRVDAVSVVRCKDCKYYKYDNDFGVNYCDLSHRLYNKNFYCAFGEMEKETE